MNLLEHVTNSDFSLAYLTVGNGKLHYFDIVNRYYYFQNVLRDYRILHNQQTHKSMTI